MTAQKSARRTSSAWLATITAALLAVSGAAIAPTAALADTAPEIKLSKTLLDPSGDTLTVSGTGFDASFKGLASYYPCSDNANAPKGFYVQVGWIKDTWKPSEGGASGAANDRLGAQNTWFADGSLNCLAPSVWTIEADGTASFEYTFEVTREGLGNLPEGARYAVFTHGGAGTTGNPSTQQPVNELSADIDFFPGTVAGEVTGADNRTGLSVDVNFTGALPTTLDPGTPGARPSNGAYAAIIEAGTASDLTPEAQGVVSAHVSASSITEGVGSVELKAAPAKLDRNKSYEVIVWHAHALATNDTIIAYAPLEVTGEQWDEVFKVSETGTTVKLSKSSAKYNAANSATVTVAATGSAEQPTGAVLLRVAGQSYKANLSNGKATIRLNKAVRTGSHKATVAYTSNAARFANSSGSATLRVTKATPKVSAKLVKSKVKTKQNARVRVTATIPGSLKAKAAKYTVQVFDGKKRIKTQKLSSAGKATVKLPKLKRGTHKIKVKLVSTANTVAKTSATRTLRVVR